THLSGINAAAAFVRVEQQGAIGIDTARDAGERCGGHANAYGAITGGVVPRPNGAPGREAVLCESATNAQHRFDHSGGHPIARRRLRPGIRTHPGQAGHWLADPGAVSRPPAQIEADARHHAVPAAVPAAMLDEYAAKLALADHQIIGPFHLHVHRPEPVYKP